MILNFMVSVSPPPTDIFIFQAAGSYIDARLFHQKLTHMFDIVAFSELFQLCHILRKCREARATTTVKAKVDLYSRIFLFCPLLFP